MDESVLFNGVLRSVFGGRRRRSHRALRYLTRGSSSFWTNPTTLLTAAGVAWGIYETLQSNTAQSSTPAAPGTAAPSAPVSMGGSGATATTTAPLPPLPVVGASASVSPDTLRLLRLAISAASADGVVTEEEKRAILEQANAAGVGDLVQTELTQPRPLREIVAGVTDTNERGTLYVLAFTVLRGDEQPSGAERIYLAQLANLLGLEPADAERLERGAAASIDKQM